MKDTSPKIMEIQKQIWLSKTPMERLKQFLLDNDDFFAFSRAMNTGDKKEQNLNVKSNLDKV